MTVAVRAGTLIDGTGADPRRNALVLAADGAIQGIVTDVPRGAEVVDASALTILPGLVDCHVRLAADVTIFKDVERVPLGLKDGAVHKHLD